MNINSFGFTQAQIKEIAAVGIGSGLADTLFKQAFQGPRDPRSPSYRLGCIAGLRYRLAGASLRCPYLPATAEADAWYAGTEEGHAIFRRYEADQKEAG